MARIRHLTKAPITEALIDVRVVLPGDFRADALQHAARTLAARYPITEERQASETMLQVTVGALASASTRHLGLHGVILKSEDGRNIVQFRVDGFTFNRLKPYTSWESILPEALELWQVYKDFVHPTSIPRIAVRYINHIPLGPEATDLDAYVVTGPRFPEGVAQDYSAFASRVVLEDTEQHVSAIVAQALEIGVQSNVTTLLLDIDSFMLGDLPGEAGTLETLFARLRDYKNRIFFGSLHDDFVSTFE